MTNKINTLVAAAIKKYPNMIMHMYNINENIVRGYIIASIQYADNSAPQSALSIFLTDDTEATLDTIISEVYDDCEPPLVFEIIESYVIGDDDEIIDNTFDYKRLCESSKVGSLTQKQMSLIRKDRSMIKYMKNITPEVVEYILKYGSALDKYNLLSSGITEAEIPEDVRKYLK